jgi:putative heme-binding domain-containing protein
VIAAALALLLQQAAPEPDPEAERRSFKLAEGWEATLFAADPLVAKPIQMNWDALGRLWVATSTVYPQILPGQTPDDKIVVLEDADGDGRADRSHVFADGLFIPTGVEPGHGGAYVANSTELLHLADADGDGRADRRRLLLSGFGTEDTHHIIHTFRWGPDGALYFNQSIYIHSHVETPHGPRRLGGAGVWRFRPDTYELDVFVRGMCNPWGHTFDAWGQSFGTDGAGSDGIHYLLPGATFVHFPAAERPFPGLNQGHPKYCGHEILSGRHVPEDWRGHIVANDFRAHRIVRFAIGDDGAGFFAKPLGDLLSSTDPAFRPVDVRMGPDGALYVADWYNPIINHGEVSFRDPRRDKTRGRIWRLTYKGRPLVPRPRLRGAPVPELLEHLKAPEDWTRHFARRELSERPPAEVLPALAAWVRTLRDEHDLLEALWVYETLGAVEPDLLRRLLRAREPRARAAAVRVLAHVHRRIPGALELLEERVADEHPRVRLEAVRALKEIPSERAIETALRALDFPLDRFLEYALWLLARETRDRWLPAFEAGRVTFGGDSRRLSFALQAAGAKAALPALARQLREGRVAAGGREGIAELLASEGGPEELRALFELDDPALRPRLFELLARAARERRARPSGDLARVRAYFDMIDASLVLAGAWKLEELRPELERRAEAGSRAAAEGLVALGGPASAEFFRRLAAPGRPDERRVLGVLGLAALDASAAAGPAAEVLPAAPLEIVPAFLSRKGGAEALAAALDPAQVPPDAARLGLRAIYAAGGQAPALAEVFRKSVGLASRSRELSPDEMRALVARVLSEGNAARGEEVYRRKELGCVQCHAIAGAGGNVGPDLVSLGASAPVDYIAESVLLPEKKQKEGYASLQVLTTSGDVVSGVVVRRLAGGGVVLRDAARDEIVLPREKIEASKPVGSFMPSGLADLLTEREFLDLVRFLSELGKPGPFAAGHAPVVRRWRVREGGSSAWTPAYGRVSGDLPLEGITAARAEVEVTAPGRFRVRLNSARGLALAADGRPVEPREEFELDLGAGPHALTFSVDAAARGALPLRCEIEEAPGSPGRVRIVSGK